MVKDSKMVGTSSASPYLMSYVDIVLSNGTPLSVCREQPSVLVSAQVV